MNQEKGDTPDRNDNAGPKKSESVFPTSLPSNDNSCPSGRGRGLGRGGGKGRRDGTGGGKGRGGGGKGGRQS